MGPGPKKPYLTLGGDPILHHSVRKLGLTPDVRQVVVVVRDDDVDDVAADAKLREWASTLDVVPGGARRQDSVRNALEAVHRDADLVLVHDAARPLVTPQVISAVIARAAAAGAAIAAVPVKATVKEAGDNMQILHTLSRDRLWLAQTPQGFRRGLLQAAYDRAYREGWEVTDDAQILERCGHPVEIVLDSDENIKITTPADLRIAQALLGGATP